MKIALASDVHLEFGPLEINNTDNADVLILSGDICVACELNDRDVHKLLGEHNRSYRYHSFFEHCAEQFEQVIYIAGNHEHYQGDYALTVPRLKEKLAYLTNLHVLEKQSMTIDGVTFLCGTLWTDMNRNDPQTLLAIRDYMNDYRTIENSHRMVSYKSRVPSGDWPYDASKDTVTFKTRASKFTPEDSVEDHNTMLAFVLDEVAKNPNGRFVVVGHHAPSPLSIAPQYQGQFVMNGAFGSDLSELMLDHPEIVLWTHGHMHDVFDYTIGTCRVVCNPRGYVGHELRAQNWQLKTIEI